MSLLTIFSAPKPFTNPHVALIQRNAILSWKKLGECVEIILLGDEKGLAEFATENGIKHIKTVRKNNEGTPLINAMLNAVREESSTPVLCLINADIILLPGFIEKIISILDNSIDFLIMGRRWDVSITSPIDFSIGWVEMLQGEIHSSGKLHKSKGSDYFIFTRQKFLDMPDFAIGRAGWDNWVIYSARKQGMKVIDATYDITIIHQQHDYSHLPGGIIHYTLPESDENLRLAGGKRRIFTLLDANRIVENGDVKPYPLTWKKLIQRI